VSFAGAFVQAQRRQELAELVWTRLLPHLTRDDLADIRPFGFGAEGIWQPVSINDVIRFTRYKKDGHFQMHRDGAFVYDDDTRRCVQQVISPLRCQLSCSIFTVMAYLNQDYTGGATRFRSSDAAEEQIIGRMGDVLVFNHDVEHEGEVVESGTKYILRTDGSPRSEVLCLLRH
jgi:hypothetical protein